LRNDYAIMVANMPEALIAIIGIGVLMGGAIVIIDSLILRRIRRQDPRSAPIAPAQPDDESAAARDDPTARPSP
jgi:hypothetical protein